jgi:hypothetical protein
MSVRCGAATHKTYLEELAAEVHHHETSAQVKLCFARKADGGLRSIEEEAYFAADAAERAAEIYAEGSYVRWAESQGESVNAEGLTDVEVSMGCISFAQAYDDSMADYYGRETWKKMRDAELAGRDAYDEAKAKGLDEDEAVRLAEIAEGKALAQAIKSNA